MRARRFRKRIELWQTEEVFDGVSGNTNKDILITSLWSNISTLNDRRNKALGSDLGFEDKSNTIVIKLRRRKDITYNSVNQFFKYNSYKYVVQAEPVNIDFDNSYVTLLATRQYDNEVSSLEPIPDANVVYTNYVNEAILNGFTEVNNTCLQTYIGTLF